MWEFFRPCPISKEEFFPPCRKFSHHGGIFPHSHPICREKSPPCWWKGSPVHLMQKNAVWVAVKKKIFLSLLRESSAICKAISRKSAETVSFFLQCIPTIDLPFCCRKYVDFVDRSWVYINCSQTHECGNWDWGQAIPRKEIRMGFSLQCVYILISAGTSVPDHVKYQTHHSRSRSTMPKPRSRSTMPKPTSRSTVPTQVTVNRSHPGYGKPFPPRSR